MRDKSEYIDRASGEEFEQGRMRLEQYKVKLPRDNGSKAAIEWTLTLPELPIDWNTMSAAERGPIIAAHRKPLEAALKECVACFHPPQQNGWSPEEHKKLLHKIDSLLWAPPGSLGQIHDAFVRLYKVEDFTDLTFYPARKTIADIQHGIDQFAVYKDKEGRRILLTIDYSTSKKESFSADILITPEGAYLNPSCFPMASRNAFVVRQDSADAEAKRHECVAHAMAAVLALKSAYLKQHPLAHSDGHYDLYPLERTILIDRKVQAHAGNRIYGTSHLSKARLAMLMKEDDEDEEDERRRRGKKRTHR